MEELSNGLLLVLAKLERSLSQIKVILLWLRGVETFRELFDLFDVFMEHFFIRFSELLEIGFQLFSQLSVNSVL